MTRKKRLGLALALGSAGAFPLAFLPFLVLAFFSPASSSCASVPPSAGIGEGTAGGGATGEVPGSAGAGNAPGTAGDGIAPGEGRAGIAAGGGLVAPNVGVGATGVGTAPGTESGGAGAGAGVPGFGTLKGAGLGPPPSLGPAAVLLGTLSFNDGFGG
jgi:hypothetical protein